MSGLDRVRARSVDGAGTRERRGGAVVDGGRGFPAAGRTAPDGTRALFSPVESRPPMGAVIIRCARCDQTSVLTLPRAARAMLPSVHLPLRRPHRSRMRCPACRRSSWVAIRFQL